MTIKYRKIERVRKDLLRGLKRGRHLVELCKELNILDAKGNPNPGLAHNIAYGRAGKPYEPIETEVRARLGLKPICPLCKRALKIGSPKRLPREREVWELFWRKLSATQRKAVMKYTYEQCMKSPEFRGLLYG